MPFCALIGAEKVPGKDFLGYICQIGCRPVGDDHIRFSLEGIQIPHNTASEKVVVGQGGFINDDLDTLGLHPFHDALDRALAEIVRSSLHHQTVDAYNLGSPCDDLICDEILAGPVGVYNGTD